MPAAVNGARAGREVGVVNTALDDACRDLLPLPLLEHRSAQCGPRRSCRVLAILYDAWKCERASLHAQWPRMRCDALKRPRYNSERPQESRPAGSQQAGTARSEACSRGGCCEVLR